METHIQKWGNSLAVRLPKGVTDAQSFKEGSRVVIRKTKTGIVIEVVKKPSRTLASMLKGISKENLHQEVSWGKKTGAEIW